VRRVWERGVGGVDNGFSVAGEDEPILLAFRRSVWRFGRVRREVREVRVVIWFPDRSREWMVGGRLLVSEVEFQASSSLLARMRVWSDVKTLVVVAISSGPKRVSLRPRYLMFGNRRSGFPFCRSWIRLPSKVREFSLGNRRQTRRISSHDSKRLPPISSDVILAHNEETD
jgi:hypothetical protein